MFLIFVYGMGLGIVRFAFLCLLTHNVTGRRMHFVAQSVYVLVGVA